MRYTFIPYDCLQCMCCDVLFSFHVWTNKSYTMRQREHATKDTLDPLLLNSGVTLFVSTFHYKIHIIQSDSFKGKHSFTWKVLTFFEIFFFFTYILSHYKTIFLKKSMRFTIFIVIICLVFYFILWSIFIGSQTL